MKRATAAVTMMSTLLLGACAMQEERPGALEQARQAVESAEQSVAVSRHAPVELNEAQKALQRAQRLWEEGADAERIEHQAFIAERRAEIAEARARRALAQEAIAQAGEQRRQAQVAARERELSAAQREAQQAREEAAELRRQAQEAQNQLAELEPEQTERGIVLTLDEVLFDFDAATLKPGNVREIDRLAQFLEANPDYQILIEGHTDAVGDAAYNRQLSERRAEAVRQALAQRGISRDRVRSAGLGEDFPVASNETDQGRLQNRRVEVVIAQDQPPPSRREAQMARGRDEGRRQL